VTDGQTDGQTDRIAIASIALVMRALRGAVKMQFSAHMEENALSVHPASRVHTDSRCGCEERRVWCCDPRFPGPHIRAGGVSAVFRRTPETVILNNADDMDNADERRQQ